MSGADIQAYLLLQISETFFFSFLVDITHQTDMVFYMCDCTFKHAKHAFKTI